MDERYFFENLNENVVSFSGQEANHIAKVRRKRVGDEIVGFNGDGYDYKLKINSILKNEVKANVISKQKNRSFNQQKIVVYLAMLKNEALQTAIDNLAELNVSEVKLFKADFSVATVDSKKLQKLTAISTQASKQCERADIMKITIIDKPQIKQDILQFNNAFFAYENSTKQISKFNGSFALIIGPEGGFSAEEVKYFNSFSKEISLGTTILRAEVAVVAAVSSLKAVSLC